MNKPPRSPTRSSNDRHNGQTVKMRRPAQDLEVHRAAAVPAELDLFAERRRRVTLCADEDLRADALALCTFDECTDPAALRRKGQQTLADAITTFTRFLIHRTIARAAYALQGREFEPSPESDAMRACARRVEEAVHAALRLAFPTAPGTGAFPIRRFERVFARFVGGELRTGLISPQRGDDVLEAHGVPDGANYFCFAEAALVFLRLGLRTDFWRPILRTFVGGAQIFAAAYWQRQRREWAAYSHIPRVEVPSRVVLAVIDHLHGGMDLSQLARQFGEVVGVALRHEPRLPHPAPVAKEFQ